MKTSEHTALLQLFTTPDVVSGSRHMMRLAHAHTADLLQFNANLPRNIFNLNSLAGFMRHFGSGKLFPEFHSLPASTPLELAKVAANCAMSNSANSKGNPLQHNGVVKFTDFGAVAARSSAAPTEVTTEINLHDGNESEIIGSVGAGLRLRPTRKQVID